MQAPSGTDPQTLLPWRFYAKCNSQNQTHGRSEIRRRVRRDEQVRREECMRHGKSFLLSYVLFLVDFRSHGRVVGRRRVLGYVSIFVPNPSQSGPYFEFRSRDHELYLEMDVDLFLHHMR